MGSLTILLIPEEVLTMTFAITYTDNALGHEAMEVSNNLAMWWDYERKGEITISHIDGSTDHFETSCFLVYDLNG